MPLKQRMGDPMSDAQCPYCNLDISEYLDTKGIDYGGEGICPHCHKKFEVEYDESFDGEEETQYWSINKVE